MKKHIFNIIIATLISLVVDIEEGYGQSVVPPNQWQTTTASTLDRYGDWECDTVISRTYGHSLTMSCARVSDVLGRPRFHRFVLRCMNNEDYFQFDLLPLRKVTMFTVDYMYEDITYYYIRDMRVSDSICFFCGTEVVERRYIPYPSATEVPIDETLYKGFFGRYDMKHVLRDSNAMYIPAAPGIGAGPTIPVPVTEWGCVVQIAYIDKAATLDKLWVENGIRVDGRKYAWWSNCEMEPPYDQLSMWIDPSFTIMDAKAFLIGRYAGDMSRSCLVEVYGNLGFTELSANYMVHIPTMPEEILTDVTGNDCRVYFSSRIFKDTLLGEEDLFHRNYTVGIRYYDEFTDDNDYLNNLHLYSHQLSCPNSPLGDEEYAHLSRLKNWYDGETETYYEKDFCFVYTCKDGQLNYYRPGLYKTLINHINENMSPNASFELGLYPSPEVLGAGGFLIRDLAYIGNYNMNCLAIAYKLPNNTYWWLGADSYVEIVDWGYKIPDGTSYLHLQDNFDHSVRLLTSPRATSLDVFLDGHSFLIGGYKYSTHNMELFTQRRDNILGGSEDLTCANTMKITNKNIWTLSYAKIASGLDDIINKEVLWLNMRPIATRYPVVNICTKERARDAEPTEIDTIVEQ